MEKLKSPTHRNIFELTKYAEQYKIGSFLQTCSLKDRIKNVENEGVIVVFDD